ncbi:effector-associated domain EAD1-containing protein [Nostoc sp. UIC 10630]|uniref:effector-associated domain EAD1-containing protein n=1 Tax=Nostoc sp. UIC 10630 TaxID=2100146 RepID=UPI0013D09750|nr:effector-associated domain EAD1-containing protein [Nostoc sp. UIC 10630]NEU79535.1 hypothetical protein [Nostoc sp. UIC 10630]
MDLSKEIDFRILINAIENAFDVNDLQDLIDFDLKMSPGQFIANNATPKDVARALVEDARKKGEMKKLVETIYEKRPNNSKVKSFYVVYIENSKVLLKKGLLSLFKDSNELKRLIKKILQDINFKSIKSEFFNNLNEDLDKLLEQLQLDSLLCCFMRCLYTYALHDLNQQDNIRKLVELEEFFPEKCDITQPFQKELANEDMKYYLQIYVEKAEKDILKVSAKVCPQYEFIEYEYGKHINEDSNTLLKDRINLFIEAAVNQSSIERIELFLPYDYLNENLYCLLQKDYFTDYVVTTCFSEHLTFTPKKVKNALDWYKKTPSIEKFLTSASGKLQKGDVFNCKISDLNCEEIKNKLYPIPISKRPIVIKIKPQENENYENNSKVSFINQEIAKKIIINPIQIIIWSTSEPSELNNGYLFDDFLETDEISTLENFFDTIRLLRGEVDSDSEPETKHLYLGYHLNVLYTNIYELQNLIRNKKSLNDSGLVNLGTSNE